VAYGGATVFTTRDVYEAARKAVSDSEAAQQAANDRMTELLTEAAAMGLPQPTKFHAHAVTFDAEGFARLVSKFSLLRAGARDIANGDYADAQSRSMARQMLADSGAAR
jgi:hypothetical protein